MYSFDKIQKVAIDRSFNFKFEDFVDEPNVYLRTTIEGLELGFEYTLSNLKGCNDMTTGKNNKKIREEVKTDIAKSLIDTLSVPFIAEKLDLDIEIVQDIKREYGQIRNINDVNQEIREEVARSLVDSLAVPFIATKVGVDMEKVIKYRQEYEQGLKK